MFAEGSDGGMFAVPVSILRYVPASRGTSEGYRGVKKPSPQPGTVGGGKWVETRKIGRFRYAFDTSD